MKKFNLFNEIIVVDKQKLFNAINSYKEFAINIKGEILYSPLPDKEAIIYLGQHIPKPSTPLMPSKPTTLSEILGKNYQVVEDEDRVLIKAFSNWQEIIKNNLVRASYDDTTSDGISEFSNKELEDIGWQSTEFDITYRELIEVVEQNCEGVLLCIEQKEPNYQFSGLGFIQDDFYAKEILFAYCQEKIKTIMKNDSLYYLENLSDDEKEAVEFFNLI